MKKEKIISTLLIAAILLGSMPSVCAYNQEDKRSTEDTIKLEYVGHGEFKLNNLTKETAVDINNIDSVKCGSVITAQSTNNSSIYQFSDEKYLMKVDNDTYLLADKKDININDFEQNRRIFNQYDINERSIESMEQVIASQIELGNDEFSIEIYVPSAVNSEPATRGTTTTSYYSYVDEHGDTWSLRDISIKYSNLSTPMVDKNGTSALSQSQAFANVVISATGTVSNVVSAFGVGASLYDLYVAIRGPVAYSSGSDRTYSLAVFDRIEKQSQFYSEGAGQYVDGKISHKVWVNRLDTYQYYGATGYSELIKPSVNREHYSQYWDNNAMTILPSGWEDYITIQLYDTTIVLNGTN